MAPVRTPTDPFAHRTLRRTVGALLAAAVALHVVRAATGFGGHGADDFFAQWLYDAIVATAAAAVLLRAALVRIDRGAWLALGIGLTAWTAGELYWSLAFTGNANPPYPSLADVGYLLYYPCVYVAVTLLVRRRRRAYSTGLWLDGITGGLAVAAIGAAFVLPPILDATSGSTAAVATNLAYPLGDLLVLAFLAGGLIFAGWPPDRGWLLLAAGLAVAAAVDCIYLYLVATDAYREGSIIDSGWLVAVALMAFAAWQRPRVERQPGAQRGTLLAPVVCAIGAVGLGAYGTLHGMHLVAALLTTATLVAVVLRLALTLRENAGMLRLSRLEANTDPLTGLSNRRRLMLDLERELAAAEPDSSTFALFDLDGFKHYNDTFGHPAGDALLRRLAKRLTIAAGAASGHAYRMSGDEFCVLIPGTDAQAASGLEAVALALEDHGEEFVVTSSFGAIELPREAADAATALRVADQRMYARKESRRTSVHGQTKAVLLQVLDESEPDLGEHLRDVARLAVATARRLGMRGEAVDEVARAAELHDIGKVAVPDAILHKPGPLNADEWAFVHEHTVVGERILSAAPALAPVGRIVRSTHERWDGAGYPDRLAGDAIPLGARVVAVCDAYDAMTTDRPYRRALTSAEAVEELCRCSGGQFDPAVVDAFASTLLSPRRTIRDANPTDAKSAAAASEI